MLIDQIFKVEDLDFAKLNSAGFMLSSGVYKYSAPIMDGQFILCVEIFSNEAKITLIDALTAEPYTLHLVDDAFGSFVGQVRKEFVSKLEEISIKCRKTQVFATISANEITAYIKEAYCAEPEFLWESTPKNAIWRRTDNDKWIAALLTVKKSKLGLYGLGDVEIINLRINPLELDRIVDERKFFRGYHMNKRNWVSIKLDGSVPMEEIKKRIDDSYALAKKN